MAIINVGLCMFCVHRFGIGVALLLARGSRMSPARGRCDIASLRLSLLWHRRVAATVMAHVSVAVAVVVMVALLFVVVSLVRQSLMVVERASRVPFQLMAAV